MDPWTSFNAGVTQAFTWIGTFFSHLPPEFIALLIILALIAILANIFRR